MATRSEYLFKYSVSPSDISSTVDAPMSESRSFGDYDNLCMLVLCKVVSNEFNFFNDGSSFGVTSSSSDYCATLYDWLPELVGWASPKSSYKSFAASAAALSFSSFSFLSCSYGSACANPSTMADVVSWSITWRSFCSCSGVASMSSPYDWSSSDAVYDVDYSCNGTFCGVESSYKGCIAGAAISYY